MKWKEYFKDKKITVFGLGLHGGGVGTVKFLAQAGAKITVTDIKTKEQLVPSIKKLEGYKNIRYVLGQHRMEDFSRADIVVKSPPIPWNNPYIKHALKHKVAVEMDSSLFMRFCDRPVIGITGTKGKTTVSILIYEILRSAGLNPIKVGVGQAPVLDKLLELKNDSVVVFELSSWRLSALGRAQQSPHIGVFKNFLPDHLNYYSTIESYLNDKKYIYQFQGPKDYLVINHNDKTLCSLVDEVPSQIINFSLTKHSQGQSVFLDDRWIYLNDGVDEKKIIPLYKLKIRGKHNIANVMAAIGAAHAYGIDIENIRKAVEHFTGVPHRLELVGEVRGIKYYNDTSATMPEAAISAIESFTQSVILIAGGSSKGLKYDEFARVITQKVKDIVFFKGKASEQMKENLSKLLGENQKASDFVTVDTMEDAVTIATEKAQKNDVVLLSPAAASFGLFDNEFDRGDQFRKAVKKLENN
jgi:UDP-N-acetylmuramoylalanine--D-glutamate ligase